MTICICAAIELKAQMQLDEQSFAKLQMLHIELMDDGYMNMPKQSGRRPTVLATAPATIVD